MNFEKFNACLCEAYRRGEVSLAAISGMNKLCSEYGLGGSFDVEGLAAVEQPNLIFHGPSDAGLRMVDEKQPKITVIVPTYNRSDFLCRCVDSTLAQSYENIEIIIINDCSTDNTSEVVAAKYGNNKRVVYIENETNLGPGGNRQKAYLVSTGEYVVFADDDDYYFDPEFFRRALAMFYDRDDLSMVCANSIFFDEVNKTFDFQPLTFAGVMDSERFLFGFNSKYRKPNSTFPTVFKKTVLDKADFANMKMMNDASIYMRAACFGGVCMIKDWVGVYWFHETNISKNLPFEFIIENLDEKNNIYALACTQFGKKNPEWLLTQQMHTIAYYINSRRLGMRKYSKLKKWIKKNGGDVKDVLLEQTKKRYKGK